MPILIDGHNRNQDNKGFLLDNEEVSDLLEIRHWWKNRRDVPTGSSYGGRYGEPIMYSNNHRSNSFGYGSNSYGHPDSLPEHPGFRKPRSQSVNFDTRTGPYMSNRAPRTTRSPRSPRRRGKKKRHKSKVGGIRNMISRAVHRSSSIENMDGRSDSSRQRAHNYRQQYLESRQHDGDDSDEESSSREDFIGKFNKERKALPKLLHPNEKRDWDKLTVQQQIERLKNSARREALVAQAKLWEAQEKQKLLQQLSESENYTFVQQALEKMKDGSSDPIFKRLTNCVLDDDTPAGRSSANGRTRRNSNGEIFE